MSYAAYHWIECNTCTRRCPEYWTGKAWSRQDAIDRAAKDGWKLETTVTCPECLRKQKESSVTSEGRPLDACEKASAIFEKNSATCSHEFEEKLKFQAENQKLKEAVDKLMKAGESIAFYYLSHGDGCDCIPCQRVRSWKECREAVLRIIYCG